jgi:hypothetical protein
MEALYKIKTNDLDPSWIDSIKKLFGDKEITIKISTEMDETGFLTLYPANEEHLTANIASEPSARFSGEEFIRYVKKKKK